MCLCAWYELEICVQVQDPWRQYDNVESLTVEWQSNCMILSITTQKPLSTSTERMIFFMCCSRLQNYQIQSLLGSFKGFEPERVTIR